MKKTKPFAIVYALNGQGGAEQRPLIDLSHLAAGTETVWIHLNLSDSRAARWLKKQPEFTDWVLDNLIEPDISEPRMRVRQNNIFLVLRTVNMMPKSEPDDLVFLRLFASEKVLITTYENPALNFAEIDALFRENDGPIGMTDLIPMILEHTLDSVADSVSGIEDQVDDMEEAIITGRPNEKTYQNLSEFLRQVIVLRRFMLPEREVLDNLMRHSVVWFTPDTERSIRDDFDRIRRIVEDIDLLEKRIRINQDALSHAEDRQTQRNTYMLSLIAGIFLPLSFLAGIFGMNLGGIPLGASAYGFWTVNLVMILIGILIWILFKYLKWV